MKLMAASIFALVCLTTSTFASADDAAAEARVRDLKARLAAVTMEANLLWKYVGTAASEYPDVASLNRAADLMDKRRGRKK